MPKAYYSTVFEQPADEVWDAVRAFDDYAWAGTGIDAVMEDGKAGDAVGGVRRLSGSAPSARQRLLAHSDADRYYSYEFCEPSPFPVRNYQATLRITPVTDGNQAFVEWWATFDCDEAEHDKWIEQFTDHGFAQWLGSLRAQLS
jgi:hypothetical protein